MAERLPPVVYDTENTKPAYLPNGLERNGVHYPDANELGHLRYDSIGAISLLPPPHLILPQSLALRALPNYLGKRLEPTVEIAIQILDY